MTGLRGYIDSAGLAHFIGYHAEKYPNLDNSGPYIVYFDGHGQKPLFKYERFSGEPYRDNPWSLLVDAHGKEHVIRKPLKTEKECVRDYPIENGELGDPTDVVAPDKAPGGISDWQATQLSNGKMAVTAALSQKGGWNPDDVDLFVSTSSGDGKWTKPVNLTDNVKRQAFMSKETSAGGVMKSDVYRPDFAECVDLGGDGVGVLMVNTDSSIIGITHSGVTGSGSTVGSLATGSTAAPWVFYRKI